MNEGLTLLIAISEKLIIARKPITRCYKFKKVNITTLRDNTIRGAQGFIELGNINAENMPYQVGSNDLEDCEPEEVVENVEKLILDTQRQTPDSNIIISQILLRFYRNQQMRHEYEIKRMKCNQLLSVLCEEYKVKYVLHTNLSQIHFGDGVHLSKDSGIALCVRNLKEILNPLLGVKNEQRNEPRNNNPMRNRNMRNNYDGQYRNNETARQS